MRISVGIDVAKDVHWATAIDERGEVLLDRAVDNSAADIEQLAAELKTLGGERTTGLDLLGGIAAVLAALLLDAGESVVHVPGLVVNRARQGTVGGESKSDPRDARVIADQVRVHQGLRAVLLEPECVVELRLLVARRRELSGGQTRRLSQLHELLVSIHPELERSLDLTNKGPLWLLTRFVSAAEIRGAGRKRLLAHVRKASVVPHPEAIADVALAASAHLLVHLPGEALTAELCRELATEALQVRERIRQLDGRLEELLSRHPDSALIQSLPGMGVVLASEFIAEVGNRARFRDASALAAAAGLAPVLRQSGRQRFLRRAHMGNKGLKRVFYQSAFASLRCPESRAFYDRKRAEGKRHHQAVIALARRRVNVLWAMLRDRHAYQDRTPALASGA